MDCGLDVDSVESVETSHAKLLDLSRGGAKLSVLSCIPFEEAVSLTVKVSELELEFEVAAEIAWSRLSEDGNWHVGCSFDPSLPDSTLGKLASGGYLERRRNPRYSVSMDAIACWELTDVKCPVKIINFSIDGFCMECEEREKTGHRLLLHLEMPDGTRPAISAKMHWQVKSWDRYLVGCSFLNGHDFNYLWDLSSLEPAETAVKPTPKWMLVWFAAIIAFIVAYPMLVPFLTQNHTVATAMLTDKVAPKGTVAPAADTADDPVYLAVVSPTGAKGFETGGREYPADDVGLRDGQPAPLPDARRDEPDLPSGSHAADVSQIEQELGARQNTQQAGPIEVERPKRHEENNRWEAQREEHLSTGKPTGRPTGKRWRDERNESLKTTPPRESEPKRLFAERGASERESSPQQDVAPTIEDTPNLPETSEPKGQPSNRPAISQPTPLPTATPDPTARNTDHSPPPVSPHALYDPPDVPNGPSQEPELALAAFLQGRDLIKQRQYALARDAFKSAVEHDSTNPLYWYLLAMVQYQTNMREQAERTIGKAVELEKTRPIPNWGKSMQRFQGTPRLWLENARSSAKSAP